MAGLPSIQPPTGGVLITLTPAGHALRERAARVPSCISGTVGRSEEEVASLQREIIRLRDVLNAASLD